MAPEEEFRHKQAQMSDKELIEKCKHLISLLCKTGGYSFQMTIPPNINDSDVLLSELVRRFKLIDDERDKLKLMTHGDPQEVSLVKCDLCTKNWVAVRPKGVTKLECPDCHNMVNFENINIDTGA